MVINADNGPENSGVRSQWLKRLVEFSARREITVRFVYCPPYHSKYNPIERVFGVLENYWNGDHLRTTEKALNMAEGMTYKGVHPTAALVQKSYVKGIKLGNQQQRLRTDEETIDLVRRLAVHYPDAIIAGAF